MLYHNIGRHRSYLVLACFAAAVSMDMGEALDTNKEMVTVGTSNLMSGLLCGFTGSYIFSQTIFTYRTG